jgi:hypothetical protein
MTAANTKHGSFSAQERAQRHYVRAFINRNRLVCAAHLLWRYLPPNMAARPAAGPDELATPIQPSNLPYLTPQDAMRCNVKTSPRTCATPASAHRPKPAPKPTGCGAERLAVRAEAAAQAPWRQTIARARVAKRAIHQARAAWQQKQTARRNALQPDNTASPAGRPTADAPAIPAPPPATWKDPTPLQHELAARLAGLRKPRCGEPQNDAAPNPQTGPTRLCAKSPGRIAVHREPATHPAGTKPPTTRPPTPSTSARPACHKPSAAAEAHPSRPTLADRQTETAGRYALQRENPTPPPLTRLTPTKAEALRTTTLADTRTTNLAAELAQRFGHPLPAPSWRIPQAMPATDPVANAARSGLADQQRPAPSATPEPATDRPCAAALAPGKPTNDPRPGVIVVHMGQRHGGGRQGFGLHDLPILSLHGGAPDWSMQR